MDRMLFRNENDSSIIVSYILHEIFWTSDLQLRKLTQVFGLKMLAVFGIWFAITTDRLHHQGEDAPKGRVNIAKSTPCPIYSCFSNLDLSRC